MLGSPETTKATWEYGLAVQLATSAGLLGLPGLGFRV